ncbi:MAG: MFS transporter [Thermomicrobiales bacterium]|nr:MFS transporter [Thermomicrobiales bacterium]
MHRRSSVTADTTIHHDSTFRTRSSVVCCFILVDHFDAIWLAFVIAFAQSVIGTFDDPSRGKIVRALTTDENRLSVNSFTQTGRTIASVAGTTCGGVIVVYTPDSFGVVFLLAAACYAAMGWIVAHISVDATTEHIEPGRSGNYWQELRVGLKAVRESPALIAVLVAAMTTTIGAAAATVLLTPLLVNELGISPAWFGIVEGSQAVGSVAVSLVIGVIGSRLNVNRLIVWALVGTGIVIALIGSAPNIWTLLMCMLAVGITITPVGSSFSTILQSHADPTVIGRVGAVLNMILEPFSILGMAGAGLMAERVGIQPVYWLAGLLCVIGGISASVLLGRESEVA